MTTTKTVETVETISRGELHMLLSAYLPEDSKDLAQWLLDEYIARLRDIAYRWQRDASPWEHYNYHHEIGAAEALRDTIDHLLATTTLHKLADQRPVLVRADYAVNIETTVPQFVP